MEMTIFAHMSEPTAVLRFCSNSVIPIEPNAWLKDTLEKLPVWPYRRIDELLPLRATSTS
jgi:hypothetical protein